MLPCSAARSMWIRLIDPRNAAIKSRQHEQSAFENQSVCVSGISHLCREHSRFSLQEHLMATSQV